MVCKDCGYIITPAKNHTHNLTKVAKKDATCIDPGNTEYYICDGCSDFFADSDGKTKITDTVIAPLGHTVSENWNFDETNHWRTCTVCNTVLTETQMGHEITGEKCTTCGYDNTTPVTDPGKEPGTEPESTNSAPSEAIPAGTQPQTQIPAAPKEEAFPWWGYAVIILGGITAGIGIALILIKRKKNS